VANAAAPAPRSRELLAGVAWVEETKVRREAVERSGVERVVRVVRARRDAKREVAIVCALMW